MTPSPRRTQPRLDRRRALTGAAATAVGVPLVAACAGEEQASGGSAPAGEAGAEVATTADVPAGGGLILAEAGVVVTQAQPGEFKAFSSTCTHQACQVTGVTETIDCICHGSKFSLTDGSVVQGPATEPLPEKEITVTGQRIVLG
jgi:Rieske Fe-S protein